MIILHPSNYISLACIFTIFCDGSGLIKINTQESPQPKFNQTGVRIHDLQIHGLQIMDSSFHIPAPYRMWRAILGQNPRTAWFLAHSVGPKDFFLNGRITHFLHEFLFSVLVNKVLRSFQLLQWWCGCDTWINRHFCTKLINTLLFQWSILKYQFKGEKNSSVETCHFFLVCKWYFLILIIWRRKKIIDHVLPCKNDQRYSWKTICWRKPP